MFTVDAMILALVWVWLLSFLGLMYLAGKYLPDKFIWVMPVMAIVFFMMPFAVLLGYGFIVFVDALAGSLS